MKLREQIIQAARKRVVQGFDNKKLTQDLATVYLHEQPKLAGR
jgi:type III secretion system FlhB-like substrate exporter